MPIFVPDQYANYKIFGIDPGLSNAGVSIYTLDGYTGQILNIEALTLINDRLKDPCEVDFESHSERTYKLLRLKQAFIELLNYHRPACVSCEAPFYNRLRPMAYGALVEVVSYIYSAVLEYNGNIRFETFPPMTVKKFIGAKAIKNNTVKGKIEVSDAVSNNPEIMSVLTVPLADLSEHAIDAVAVGYTSCRMPKEI